MSSRQTEPGRVIGLPAMSVARNARANGTADRSRLEASCRALVSYIASAKLYLLHLDRPLHIPLAPNGAWDTASSTGPVAAQELRSTYLESLEAICRTVDVAVPVLGAPPASALEAVVARRMRELLESVHRLSPACRNSVRARLAAAIVEHSRTAPEDLIVLAHDGVELHVHIAGARGADPILIVGPCGIPTAILEGWMKALAAAHRVITFETRGFAADDRGRKDLAMTLHDQAMDVGAVLRQCGLSNAHVMGICGGAVTALYAAALEPQRIMSISLWHGDFWFGDEEGLTRYQQDLRWLMRAAAASRSEAASLQHMLADTRAIERAREDFAHLLLFPFQNPELLHRYAHANGAIMHADVAYLLRAVHQPTLVVTSTEDETAHPQGSRRLAALMTTASIDVQRGDHLSFFEVREDALRRLRAFLAEDSRETSLSEAATDPINPGMRSEPAPCAGDR